MAPQKKKLISGGVSRGFRHTAKGLVKEQFKKKRREKESAKNLKKKPPTTIQCTKGRRRSGLEVQH